MKELDVDMLDIEGTHEIELHPCEDMIHVGRVYNYFVGTVWHWNYGSAPDVYYLHECPFCDEQGCEYYYFFKKNHFSTSKCNKYGGAISFIMAHEKIGAVEALERIKNMLDGKYPW
jgi:hypothetical protein